MEIIGQTERNSPNNSQLDVAPFFSFCSSLTPYRKNEILFERSVDNEKDKNDNERRNMQHPWKHQYCLYSSEGYDIDLGNEIILATTICKRKRYQRNASSSGNYERSFIGNVSLEDERWTPAFFTFFF